MIITMSCISVVILMFFSLVLCSGNASSYKKELTPVYITPNKSINTRPKNMITVTCRGTFSIFDKMRLLKRNPATNNSIILKESNTFTFDFQICVSSSYSGTEMYCDIKHPEKVLNETKPIQIIVEGDDDDYDDECKKSDEITTTVSTSGNTSLTTIKPTNRTIRTGVSITSPFMIGAITICLISLIIFCGIVFYVMRCCKNPKNIVKTEEEPTYAAVQYVELDLRPPRQDKPIIKDSPYAEITGVLVKKNKDFSN